MGKLTDLEAAIPAESWSAGENDLADPTTIDEKLAQGYGTTTEDAAALPPRQPAISRLRHGFIMSALLFALFLTSIESTVVATSLVEISNRLGGYASRNWVIGAYLMSYTGLMATFASFAKVMGCRFMMIFAVAIFTAFSIGCGLAQDMVTLIIMRAFQGVGGSGIFALAVVVLTNMSDSGSAAATDLAMVSSTFTLSRMVGPSIGGAISDNGGWRWAFLLNGPGGALALIVLAACLTNDMEVPRLPPRFRDRMRMRVSLSSLKKLDLLGNSLLVISLVALLTALEEGSKSASWGNEFVVTLFFCAGFAFVCFVVRENHVLAHKGLDYMAFPVHLFKGRLFWGMTLINFFVGFMSSPFIYFIPQQLQIVWQYSATDSGTALMPLMVASPLFAILAAIVLPKVGIHPFWPMVGGGALQVLGCGILLYTTLTPEKATAAMYVGQGLLGAGLGINVNCATILAAMIVPKPQLGIAVSVLNQIRLIGGTVGVAVASAALDGSVWADLRTTLSTSQLTALRDSFSTLRAFDPDVQVVVRQHFRDGFSTQNLTLLVVSAMSLLVTFLCYEKNRRPYSKPSPEE